MSRTITGFANGESECQEKMNRAIDTIHTNKTNFSLSFLLCIPLAVTTAILWLETRQESFTFRGLILPVFIVFLFLIPWIWLVVCSFTKWWKGEQIEISPRDYIVLILALVPLFAALHYGWDRYGGRKYLDTRVSRFEVEIANVQENDTSRRICILEISDKNGKMLQPENNSTSGFLLTGDWVLGNGDCQYFSRGNLAGGLRFYYEGKPGELFQILFRENKHGGKALIRLDGEPIAAVDLQNAQEGNRAISAPLQYNPIKIIIWNILGTAGWFAILIILFMMITLLLKNVRLTQQISALFTFIETHPWISFAPIAIGMVILIEVCLFNRGFVNSEILNLEERHYPITDGVLSQFSLVNGKLVAQTNNPSITFNNINLPVAAISINCVNSFSGIVGQVFYSNNGEMDSIRYDASRPETTLLLKQKFGIAQPVMVSSLRFDLTSIRRDVISCGEFVINPHIPFRVGGIRLAIYAGLLLLMFFLIKNVHLLQRIPTLSALMEGYPWIRIAPIAIGIAIMFWPTGSYQSSDVAYYLSLAKNLFHGNGYVNPDLSPAIYRGPVFPLLISLSYSLFGETFRSAVIMERIFWALTILISYILGKELFNQRTGFLASLFVLSASVVNIAFSFVMPDGPLVLMILLLQLIFWETFSKQRSNRWYVLVGLFMGIAYFLKQTAIFITPLLLLLWIGFSRFRTRQTLKKLLISYSIFALFFFGWKGYVYLAGGSPKQVAGDLSIGFSMVSRLTAVLNPNAEQTSSSQIVTPYSYSISLPQILTTYYSRDVLGFFRIAPFILLALGFTLFQAIVKKSNPDIFLSIGLFLFSTQIPIQVVVNFGYRQNLYFFIIGMICIAAMIERLFNKVVSKTVSNSIIAIVAACLIVIQITGGNYGLRQPTPVINRENLNYFRGYQKVADWVDDNIKPDEKILVDEREADILHILTHDNRRFEFINNCRGEQWYFWPAIPCKPPYISFWIYNGKTNPEDPRDFLQGISEPLLISTINEKDVKYIFVTRAIYSLYYYLKIHPDFEEVTILGNSASPPVFAIFRIHRPVQPISRYPRIRWETCVGQGTSEYLNNLEQSNPARYEARLRDEIEPWMGLSEQDLKTFQNWQGCQFDVTFPGEFRLP